MNQSSNSEMQFFKNMFLLENPVNLERDVINSRLSKTNVAELFLWSHIQYKEGRDKIQQLQNEITQCKLLKEVQICISEKNKFEQYQKIIKQLEEHINGNNQTNLKRQELNKQIIDGQQKLIEDLQENQKEQLRIIFQQQNNIFEQEQYKIQEDNKFKEDIKKLNQEKENIIKQVNQIIKQAEPYQQRIMIQPDQIHENDVNDYQNIINLIKHVQSLITNLEKKQELLQQNIDQEILNDRNNNIGTLKQLQNQLKQNQQFVTTTKIVFARVNDTIKFLQQKTVGFQKQNRTLLQDLKTQQDQNKEKNQQITDLMTKLKNQFQIEQDRIQDQIRDRGIEIRYDQEDRLYISDKYAKIYINFIEKLIDDIYKIGYTGLKEVPRNNNNMNGNQNLIEPIQSFISNIENQVPSNDVDSKRQKWIRSVDLFQQIYNNLDQNNSTNIHLHQLITQVEEILKNILDYKKIVEECKNQVEKDEKKVQR